MKKQTFVAMLLVLALLMVQFYLPEAMAATNYDPCKTGNHVMEYQETLNTIYGGKRKFDVDSCTYVSYPHKHYYTTYSDQNVYECVHCAYTEIRWVQHDDLDLGPICTIHDNGK